jgi:hypothetical protein
MGAFEAGASGWPPAGACPVGAAGWLVLVEGTSVVLPRIR